MPADVRRGSRPGCNGHLEIALVSPYDVSCPGGVTKHVLNLQRVFHQMAQRCRILTVGSVCQQPEAGNVSANARLAHRSGAPPVPSELTCLSRFVVPVRYNGSVARLSLSPWLGRRVHQVLQRERFDILHVHEPANPTLSRLALHHTAWVSPATALVGTWHSYLETEGGPHLMRLWQRHLWHLARSRSPRLDGCIAVSPVVREYANQLARGMCRVIPNGVDLALFGNRSLPPLPDFSTGLNLLYVGRLEPRKGLTYLLEAYARVKVALPQVRLLIVGPYSVRGRRPFECLVRRLRLGDVHFVGYLPEQELARYYQHSAVFCAPACGSESFGMVLLEAMAAGIPIVASDIEGYRNVMSHQKQGLLIPPRHPMALADALLHLLKRPDLRQAMGACGRATAAQYAWENIAYQVLQYYNEVLERKRASVSTFA